MSGNKSELHVGRYKHEISYNRATHQSQGATRARGKRLRSRNTLRVKDNSGTHGLPLRQARASMGPTYLECCNSCRSLSTLLLRSPVLLAVRVRIVAIAARSKFKKRSGRSSSNSS